MEPFGAVWIHLEPIGSIWSYLKPLRAFWSLLEQFQAVLSHFELSPLQNCAKLVQTNIEKCALINPNATPLSSKAFKSHKT